MLNQYYTILEVATILKITPQQLRIIEQEANIEPIRRRGRRYYNQDLIAQLSASMAKSSTPNTQNLTQVVLELKAAVTMLEDA